MNMREISPLRSNSLPFVMNLSSLREDGSKGLHPGAIFVGDDSSLTIGKLDKKEKEQSQIALAPRLHQDATVLFAKTTDKKRAMANAKFLSECCMSGVPAAAATTAASDAHDRFEKWWVRQCFTTGSAGIIRPTKRKRRNESPEAEYESSEAGQTKEVAYPEAPRVVIPDRVKTAKINIKRELKRTGGDTTTPVFLKCVETLGQWYSQSGTESGEQELAVLDGSWRSLNRPSFSECLGITASGEYMYTLGRIAFDVFRPTNLVCSIKGVYNLIQPVAEFNRENGRPRSVPHGLLSETNTDEVRIYDTISLIQIEAGQTRSGLPTSSSIGEGDYLIQEPIQARMTNYGFLLSDPEIKSRYTVHFTGGSLRPRYSNDLPRWRELFDPQLAPPYKIKELAHMLASNIYLGAATQAMQEDGSLRYSLKRPIGGHGQTFVDVLYKDDDFRLIRGHHGSYFCFCR